MSVKLQGFIGLAAEQLHAWPEALCPEDPYCGDEVLDQTGNYANYCVFSSGEKISQGEHDEADSMFCASLRKILIGQDAYDELNQAAMALQIDFPATHDRRPARVAPFVLAESRLSDIVENWVPDIGVMAPDRVLGPWSDEPLSDWLRALCGRVFCFSPVLYPTIRPMGRESKSRPRPDLDTRRVLIAMMRAPTMLWWSDPVTPALPISDRWIPDGQVSGVPEAPAFVGRIYKTPEGWQTCCVLPLAIRPDPIPLKERIRLELMRLRRFERRVTWEDVLRDRGEVLYRSVCEQLWLQEDHRNALAAHWSSHS